MRLARLDLTAFGHFTGTKLSFPSGDIDLHVIHGPNEAGKSTLRMALLDLFYGIHAQTPYDFKHGYAKMELGGRIEDDTLGALEFRRFKKNKNPLVNADGAPLADAELARFLLRTDRDSFQRMFAIDHRQLLAGEGEIMAAGSDIGHILFGAAAGVGNLSELRAKIDAEAEDLWGPRKKNDHLFTQAALRLDAAQKKLDRVSLSAADWRSAKAALDEAVALEKKVEDEIAQLAARRSQLRRVVRVAAPLARWREAKAHRETLRTPVTFPCGADETFSAADTSLKDVLVRGDAIRSNLKAQKDELAGITLSLALTDHAADIRRLHGRLEKVASAEDDLPGVERDLAEVVDGIERGARYLGWRDTSVAGVAGRLPSPVKRDDVSAHLKLYNRLANTVEYAHSEYSTKEAEVKRLTELLATAPEAVDLPALNVAISAAQGLNYSKALAEVERAVRQAEADLVKARKGIAPWHGSDEELAASELPSAAEASGLFKERVELAAARKNADDRFAEQETALAHATQALAALTRERTAVTPETVLQHRTMRDQLWGDIRDGASPLATAAAPFEDAMRQADTTADQCFNDADLAAQQRELTNTKETRQIDRDAAKQRLDSADVVLKEFDARWHERVGFIELGRYVDWAQARVAALNAIEAVKQTRKAKVDLLDNAEALSERLRSACGAAGAPCYDEDFAVLLEHAIGVQKGRTEARIKQDGWRDDLTTQSAALTTAKRKFDAAEAALAAWTEERAKLLDTVRIARDTGNDGAETALNVLKSLEQALAEEKKLAKRVKDMQDDISGFATAALALAHVCAPDLDGASPADVARQLDARLRAEEQRVADHKRLTDAVRKSEEELTRIDNEKVEAEASIASLKALAGVETVDALRAAIDLWSKCRAADARIAETYEAVINTGDGLPIEQLEAEVEAEELAAIPGEQETLDHKLKDAEDQRTRAVEGRTIKQDALAKYAGQDDAVRAEAERQDALLLMREAAEGYFRQAMGAKLLGWATKRYAERKHGPLLNRASVIFEKLTLGNFDRLAIGHHDNDTRLYAYRPDGTHIIFGEGLSTGTEAQLYLALRLASLEQHIESGNVLPFLGDDLMMGWDEERVAAGMKVLADLARKTQVILLTYSATVAQIASETLGEAADITTLPRNVPKAA